MSLTKKQQTINAHRALIKKYRNPVGQVFCTTSSCKLCLVHDHINKDCYGCPMSLEKGLMGCMDFQSYQNLGNIKYTTLITKIPNKYQQEKLELRAQFHEKIIPILEKIPAKRFTKRGWTYFDELDRSW